MIAGIEVVVLVTVLAVTSAVVFTSSEAATATAVVTLD